MFSDQVQVHGGCFFFPFQYLYLKQVANFVVSNGDIMETFSSAYVFSSILYGRHYAD